MPNIATVLKAEITRLARKEMHDGGDAVKKSVANHRSEIASLKRRIQDLEAAVKRLAKAQAGATGGSRAAKPEVPEESSATGLRFRAKGMAANRKRLGLSAEDFGLLVGATGKSIYSWEAGKTKPRSAALAGIAALRGIGKQEAQAKLNALKAR